MSRSERWASDGQCPRLVERLAHTPGVVGELALVIV
jgi:hypothetical protein